MVSIAKAILHDMVTLTSHSHFTIGREAEINRVTSVIRDELQEKEMASDPMLSWYAQCVVMITNMEFNWKEGVPEHYTSLEKWWQMVESNKDTIATYMFFRDNVWSRIISEMIDVVIENLVIWKPDEERVMQETSDPN